jgi:hypothetical protein
MAIEALEIRMAKLEGGYEQINERLGSSEQRVTSELALLRSELVSLWSEMGSIRAEMATRSDLAELRRQMNAQFFWLLTFVLGSILVPILRDLGR